MEKESITFVNQLIGKLEENTKKLEQAKNDNDPRSFNQIKRDSFKIHEELGKLIK